MGKIEELYLAAKRMMDDMHDRDEVIAYVTDEEAEENGYPQDVAGDYWHHDAWNLQQALDALSEADVRRADLGLQQIQHLEALYGQRPATRSSVDAPLELWVVYGSEDCHELSHVCFSEEEAIAKAMEWFEVDKLEDIADAYENGKWEAFAIDTYTYTLSELFEHAAAQQNQQPPTEVNHGQAD